MCKLCNIVDRGFQRALLLLSCFTEAGMDTKMPSFIDKGEKQLETEKANQTQFATKVRWAVESYDARIRNFKKENITELDEILAITGSKNITD